MHHAAVWQHSSNSNFKIVHNFTENFLWNPSNIFSGDVLSCLWIVFTNSVFQVPRQKIVRRVEILGIGWLGVIHLREMSLSHGNLCLRYSSALFEKWGGVTDFVKKIHRQERTSSEEKSDGFHKKCSVELWAILMFELLLCYHTAALCMERT